MFATAKADLGGATYGTASHGDDKGLFVEFEMRSVHQPFKSEQEGRAVWADVPFVIINFPGDRTKRFEGVVEEEHKHRFPRQWAAFEAQKEQVPDGTPIAEWPPLTKSQVFEFKAMKIHTVEALADLPDSACTWMGSREIREKARIWLATAAGHSADARLQAIIKTQNDQIEALQKQIADINARATEKSDDSPRGPGRPRKATALEN